MQLVEAIEFSEAALERRLTGDEITLVARMVESGEDNGEQILAMLQTEIDVADDEEGETFLYEASGEGVVQIPEPLPEEADAD